jgi:CDP-glycerol glycerophosphotransferase (TagB/SpsB family)
MIWKRELSFWKAGKREQKALRVRAVFHVLHACKRKEIWLISDRISRADDNGECFFRYLQENPQKNIIPYFVMDKNCPDYDRMKQYGKVIPVYSWKHKLAHLLCDCILSSQANKPVLNPFGNFAYLYKDLLYDKKFVFLQHGVTKDDQSAWLNRYNRNMYGFVVATRDEYASIFESEYFYSPDNVWLTGMPRYDRLYRDEQKYITIMPTWRKSLSGGVTSKGEWTIGDTFAESNYFKFYNALLSHPRLLDAAQERGYQVCFMPHPNITPAIPLFDHDPRVNFWKADKSYRDVFAQSDLIVTDYSSVAFDFAYLRKPLVYAQFDREEFFSGSHSYTEGYFNYQTDGFGEIKENMEDLVDCLIEYMDNGCQLKEEYRERIERTFAFADQNCCARVLEKMLEIHEK